MRVSSFPVYLNMLVILSFSLSDTSPPSLSLSLSLSLYYMLYIHSGVTGVMLIVKYAVWLARVTFKIIFKIFFSVQVKLHRMIYRNSLPSKVFLFLIMQVALRFRDCI
jgi:hypothetical protein